MGARDNAPRLQRSALEDSIYDLAVGDGVELRATELEMYGKVSLS